MEDGDTEKYHPSSVIQDFVFLNRKRSCVRCISLQVYNKVCYFLTKYTVIKTSLKWLCDMLFSLGCNYCHLSAYCF